MQYGICKLSIVAVRSLADDTSEMITQLLYGEHYKILEQRKHWNKIRIAFDKSEGWIRQQQTFEIPEIDYKAIDSLKCVKRSTDLVSHVSCDNGVLLPVVLGSSIPETGVLPYTFEGSFNREDSPKSKLIDIALLYLNTPFLWGGKTPFGIDCSGFTQMVYKINGFSLKRNAAAQATQGEALSFIEESEPGDLAFFDNAEGEIDHVGLIMENNYIVHVYGAVRIDRIDHTGIFNTEENKYTHKLRVIKKVL